MDVSETPLLFSYQWSTIYLFIVKPPAPLS